MEKVLYKVVLNVKMGGSQQRICGFRTEESSSREIEITLIEDSDMLYIGNENSVFVYGEKSDGTTFMQSCKAVDGKIIFVPLSGVYSAEGDVKCQVQVLSPDGEILYSPSFTVEVGGNLRNSEAVESRDEFTALDEALRDLVTLYPLTEADTETLKKLSDSDGTLLYDGKPLYSGTSSGGTGGVSDVYVNGKSVVRNSVAQIEVPTDYATKEYVKNAVEAVESGEGANPLEGKIVSLMGDSISSYEGTVPVADGVNLSHGKGYPMGDVDSLDKIWWKRVLDALGMKLGINESWDGTCVCNSSETDDVTMRMGPKITMSGMTRIENLGSNGTPDIILFYGGTNDVGRLHNENRDFKISLGEFNSAEDYKTVDTETVKISDFASAYRTAIMRMQYLYPTAQIVAILPSFSGDSEYYTNAELNSLIETAKSICDYFGVMYIDLRRIGVTVSNWKDYYIIDGGHYTVHPNEKGMKLIGDHVAKFLSENCLVTAGENITHKVIHLTNGEVTADKSFYKSVSEGASFSESIKTADNYEIDCITVEMGDEDITDTAYADGRITVENVSGELKISIKAVEMQKFVVENSLTNTKIDNEAVFVYNGKSYTSTLTADSGYKIVSVTVTMNGEDITEEVWANGIINIPSVNGDVLITAVSEELSTFTVTKLYDEVTDSNGLQLVREYDAYSNTLTVNTGYEIQELSVTMGGTDITETAYNAGIISIERVTGDIVITARTEAAKVYTVTNNLTKVTTNNVATEVYGGTAYTATLIPSQGHAFVVVEVKMDGIDITEAVWSDGAINIPLVSGNIEITAEAAAQIIRSTLNSHAVISRGDKLTADVHNYTNLLDILTTEKTTYSGGSIGWGEIEQFPNLRSVTFAVKPGDKIAATSMDSKDKNGSGTYDGIRISFFKGDEPIAVVEPADTYYAYHYYGSVTVPEGADCAHIPLWKVLDSEIMIINIDREA